MSGCGRQRGATEENLCSSCDRIEGVTVLKVLVDKLDDVLMPHRYVVDDSEAVILDILCRDKLAGCHLEYLTVRRLEYTALTLRFNRIVAFKLGEEEGLGVVGAAEVVDYGFLREYLREMPIGLDEAHEVVADIRGCAITSKDFFDLFFWYYFPQIAGKLFVCGVERV